MVNKRGKVTTDIGNLGVFVESFDLAMRVEGLSPKTRSIYTDAARWYAGWLVDRGVTTWPAAGKNDLRAFFVHLEDLGYAKQYRHQIGTSLLRFAGWLVAEEEYPHFFHGIKPPPGMKLGEKPVPVLAAQQVRDLISDAEKGRDFISRRDAALLRLFGCTGGRLAEIAGIDLDDIDIKDRTVRVTGKFGKVRDLKYDHKCALAIDRYLRVRATHASAGLPCLWLGRVRGQRLTNSGIRQMMTRRADRHGIKLWPHLWRHTFSHNWLDNGGSEGDLMELNGWESQQMLAHYGRSARGARARRAYDRIDVMRGV
jgi:site-specific recombinase XerC